MAIACAAHATQPRAILPARPAVAPRLNRWVSRMRRLSVNPSGVRVRADGTGGHGKMYVPSDSFGGVSPEKKAADILRTLHTFISARVVMAQLEGSGRGSLASYNAEYYDILVEQLETVPMKDGDEWLAQLMKKNKMLGARISEVRAAYAENDFEWDQVQRLVVKDTKEANVTILRRVMNETVSLD